MCGWPTIQTVGLLVKSCWRFQSRVRMISVRPIAFLLLRFFLLNTTYIHLSYNPCLKGSPYYKYPVCPISLRP
jgi:hypothetical protein